MRKSHVRIKTIRDTSPTGRRARRPVRSKAVGRGKLAECKTYVTENHYDV